MTAMTGGSGEDGWVKAAMTDDTMVVDLLVGLHRAPPSRRIKTAAFPLEWSVRQRRSKPVSVGNSSKKPAHRASPTTPLSWSGATSFSGGGVALDGGLEESSRPSELGNCTRSKVNDVFEKTTSKRSRKKKTLTELKEEENLLVKERRELKRDIAALRINLEKQMAKNESLKRMKIELQPLQDGGTTSMSEETISGQLQQKKTYSISPMVIEVLQSSILKQKVPCARSTGISSQTTESFSPKQKAVAAFDPKFVLPDLNMPFEEEPIHDVTCGVC